jgi:hypothetical protein
LHCEPLVREYLTKLRERESYILDQSELTDPELDALRHRYQQGFLAIEERTDTLPAPTDYDQTEITKGDVEDMKTRFMRFYEYEMDEERKNSRKKKKRDMYGNHQRMILKSLNQR